MSEKPILFSGAMVRAILEGRKTQTRRVIKPQPSDEIDDLHGGEFRKRAPYKTECPATGRNVGFGFQDDDDRFWHCPYGAPGDRLWVRETWCPKADPLTSRLIYHSNGVGYQCHYRADGEEVFCDDVDGFTEWNKDGTFKSPWKPSIHMPRWASRITLEITGVRVERLQEISQADAIAEGAPPSHRSIDKVSQEFGFPDFSRSWYAQLWESINGKGSWEKNPWVWVIEFKRADGVSDE